MTQEQAHQLSAAIEQQFLHVEVDILQSQVRAQQWLVAVRRREVPPDSQALIIYNDDEWQDALIAVEVLCK